MGFSSDWSRNDLEAASETSTRVISVSGKMRWCGWDKSIQSAYFISLCNEFLKVPKLRNYLNKILGFGSDWEHHFPQDWTLRIKVQLRRFPSHFMTNSLSLRIEKASVLKACIFYISQFLISWFSLRYLQQKCSLNQS